MSTHSTELNTALTWFRQIAGTLGNRALRAPGFFCALLLLVSVQTADAKNYPQTPEAMLEAVSEAIYARDFDMYSDLVHWDRAGRVKFNVVRYQVYRSMGRKIASINIEEVPPGTFDDLKKRPQIAFNLEPTHRVRVVYDEPPNVKGSNNPPVIFHLVGKTAKGYRIALVVRNGKDDDDD
jgi:hypothetical protein